MTYDFAIIGAGVSGLTLAWQLLSGPLADQSILLIDGAQDDDELRTLSFWSRDPVVLEPLVRHRWHELRICDGEHEHRLTLRDHSYRTLFFADLQHEAKLRISRDPRHRIVSARLTSLTPADDGLSVVLKAGGNSYAARWVFDSRHRRTDLHVDTRRWHSLRQYFHGWIVRTEQDVFSPALATIFDFRVAGPPGTCFAYVLPLAPREALVEVVSLSPIDAESCLRGYLRRAYGLDRFTIVGHEAGLSPMTEQPFPRRSGERVRLIGIPSGRLKPSTGYALTRIFDEAAAIVRSLTQEGHPFAAPPDSRLYRLLDGVLLDLWEHEPGLVPSIFLALFSRNPPDRVLRFLDEQTTPAELVRLITSLPAAPFLRAVARWLGRRLGIGARSLPPRDPPAALPPARSCSEQDVTAREHT